MKKLDAAWFVDVSGGFWWEIL